ncbi:MAG: iron-containing alcohol dehydrogenase [Desulfovibrio sp.]|uniref:iron-containing alcohol dehydrogenase n=1 Tax=Desulfovibrio sp. TaxID=885 RepID=UPI0025C18F3A|nr:iron-containing alcohol dehydrogenase [Desulfovibrio sp.]MCI7567917.1 iron-containing alcohol dehydrogenase [Desulfovibrio sp.]
MSTDVKSMHMGQITSFFIPTVTLVGANCSSQIPARLMSLGAKKPLIVTDKGIVAVGILKQITDILDAAKLSYEVFDETVPNPTDNNVAAATEAYKKGGCDSLITLGGGSSHDCGKGVGFVVSNGGKIHDYEGVDKSSKPFPPYVAVNTTAGTASEMTRFCIITDTSRKVKMAIVDWRCTPSVAIDDPVLMMGMPPSLTAATGMDALTHAVEAYVSTAATPMTDACAEKAMEYINRYLRRAVANGKDKEAREGMCYAQYLAGMAFNNASLGHVHAMAHQLGGFYDLPHGECNAILPHGECNAILLPHVCQYNLISSRRRFGRIAKLLGERTDGLSATDASQAAIKAINIISKDVGIPEGLIALGKKYGKEVREEDIPIMTANAQKDACGLTNPRIMSDAAVAAIYKAAL